MRQIVRPLALFALLFALVSCTPALKTPPVVTPTPTVVEAMTVHVQVNGPLGVGLPGSKVRLQTGVDAWATCETDSTGHCYVRVPGTLRDSALDVTGPSEYAKDPAAHVVVARDATLIVTLKKAIPPPPSLGAPIKANFCGMRDSTGEVMFTIFLADLPESRRMEWYRLQREAGLTHMVIAAKGGYRGFHEFDWTRQPEKLKALITEVIAQGFRPIGFLSSGDGGTGDDADAYFGSLLDGLGPLANEVHWVPGWEVVKGGWTSRQFYHAVEVIDRHVLKTTPIWFHGSDGRATFASYISSGPGDNPPNGLWVPNRDKPGEGVWIEADDPTHGDEAGAWLTPMGRRLAGLLYQSESGRPLLRADDEPLDYLGQRGWRGRATEVFMRLGRGERGWVTKRVVAFETVGEDYFAGRATDADVARIANEAAAIGFTEFGNGIPPIK